MIDVQHWCDLWIKCCLGAGALPSTAYKTAALLADDLEKRNDLIRARGKERT